MKMSMENWWSDSGKGKQNLGGKLFVAALSTTDLIWPGLGSNPNYRVESLMTVFSSTVSSTDAK
jgi:hypothetical protein